jgi:hypothetical protein
MDKAGLMTAAMNDGLPVNRFQPVDFQNKWKQGVDCHVRNLIFIPPFVQFNVYTSGAKLGAITVARQSIRSRHQRARLD